jgi:hypothetical protein
MKFCKSLLVTSLFCGVIPQLQAQVTVTEVFNVNAAIPDYDGSGNALANQQNIGYSIGTITDLSVTLNISGTGLGGAANGDLYAYVTHGTGFSILLNRVGVRSGDSLGYDDNGLNVTFNDNAALGDVHNYRFSLSGNHNTALPGALSGSWAPDGRAIAPTSNGATFDSAPRTALLSSFQGLNMKGDWTLFIMDLSTGGTAKLDSWSLTVTAVPEPRDAALVAAAGLLAFALVHRRRQQKKASALAPIPVREDDVNT